MSFFEFLRCAQNDKYACFEILRFAQDDRFSADKTPSPFGYSLYKQRESFACLF